MIKRVAFLCSVVGVLMMALPGMAQDEAAPAIQGRFMPPNEKILFIIGQDLGAIGGLEGYSDGYLDHVGTLPAGFTTYTPINGLSGLKNRANWGSGDLNAQLLVSEPTFEDSVLVIGLWMSGGNEVLVANGDQDAYIDQLGEWIAAQDRPVFLRIGYEFDGEWNAYNPEFYVQAFRRIVDRFNQMGVSNVATVWQSKTDTTRNFGGHEWLDWYPGDAYVDWFGLTYFEPYPVVVNTFLDLAREHGKPVMIAESTPRGARVSATTNPELLWNVWYHPFFELIHRNSDVIKAVAYINVDWDAQPMWANQSIIWGDSRVQANPVILENWLEELEKDVWLHSSSDLFDLLGLGITE